MPAELAVRSAGFSQVKGMRHVSHHRVLLDELGAVGRRAARCGAVRPARPGRTPRCRDARCRVFAAPVTVVAVGDARLRIGGPVPRCAVIDHHPETGVKDLRLLKALVGLRPTNSAGEPMFGVYADVVAPGSA